MTVEPMQERHISALAAVERACFSEPWSEKALREELGRGIFLVAVEQDRCAGYVGCQTVLDEGYITSVAVSPDFRRRGVGRMLTRELLACARERKLAFVTLEVRQSNAPALALYRALGFEQVGARKLFYAHPDEDAVLMTVRLDT